MKKLIALLLALALCLGLCACGQSAPAQTDAPRADLSATPIPKPDEGKAAAAQESPVPQATERPAPEAEIEVTELCHEAGTLTLSAGYNDCFSFILPRVSGPDTPYLKELNDTVQGIYDEYVAPTLEEMQNEDSLSHYCACYTYAEREGIHSLLVTCDTDWGEDYYWCFNFDDYGEAVENESVLRAAGLTPEGFLAGAREYLTDYTDLSEYFDDDWKELQEQTLDEENLNADMPMVLTEDGALCFIATIFTPAGAGVYDRALRMERDGAVRPDYTGMLLRSRLSGTYLLDADDIPGGDGTSYLLDFFTVGDTLSVEVTGFDKESVSPYYYYVADIYPDDPADLLRGDTDSVTVRTLPHSIDVFDGMYHGEPGRYTLTADGSSVRFSDFSGGTVLLLDEFTAQRAYYDDVGLDYTVPDTDYDRFDYDSAESSGLVGIWSGYYSDDDYRTHTLTLEVTAWGQMALRDCVEGEIPVILAGSYYIAGGDDDMAPAGAVVFHLVARNGYKMPHIGWFHFEEDNGAMLIWNEPGNSDGFLRIGEDCNAVLFPVPTVRKVTEPMIQELSEGESVYADINGDGVLTEYSYALVWDPDNHAASTEIDFFRNGKLVDLSDQWLYDAKVYFVQPATTGAVYFYVEGAVDNDGKYTQVVGADDSGFWYAGDFSGGFDGTPEDVEALRLYHRLHLLSTAHVARTYRVGIGGMPEPVEPFFRNVGRGVTLTVKEDIDAWIVDPGSGEPVDTATLPAGTKVTMVRTDGGSFWDLELENGDMRRIWIDRYDGSQTVNGTEIADLFDGLFFAG